jgi:hypothetical protein
MSKEPTIPLSLFKALLMGQNPGRDGRDAPSPRDPFYSPDHDLIQNTATTVRNIETTVNKLSDNSVTKAEFKDLVGQVTDHEKRLRVIEPRTTSIMVWGSVLLIGLTVIQILLRIYGK